MKALNIKGPFRGTTGHDHHVREFVRALHSKGIKIRLDDFSYWSPNKLPEKMCDPWFETLNQDVDSKTVLHFCMPHQVVPEKKMLNVNFTMFEASRIPRKWIKHNKKHDLVILPTEACKQAWINSGHPESKIALCPLGVNSDTYQPRQEPLHLTTGNNGKNINDYKVRVLNVSDITPRKNLLGLLRVWIQTTEKTDDAILILKIMCGSDKWLRKFFKSIEKTEKEIDKTRYDSAPVHFLVNQKFSNVGMSRLYASASHYWSMSHGEGWDLSMMEAAASGLQLIAPNHSAYKTYLDEEIASMIPSKKMPAKFKWSDGVHKFFRGADWWVPDEDIAARFIGEVIENGDGSRPKKARDRIIANYTWEKSTERLIKILTDLERNN